MKPDFLSKDRFLSFAYRNLDPCKKWGFLVILVFISLQLFFLLRVDSDKYQ
jgi:hypothetical protein